MFEERSKLKRQEKLSENKEKDHHHQEKKRRVILTRKRDESEVAVILTEIERRKSQRKKVERNEGEAQIAKILQKTIENKAKFQLKYNSLLSI